MNWHDPYTYYRRGDAHYQLKQYDKAIGDYSSAIYEFPQYVFAYRSRADCYDALGKTDEAKRDREKVVQLDKWWHTANTSPTPTAAPTTTDRQQTRSTTKLDQ